MITLGSNLLLLGILAAAWATIAGIYAGRRGTGDGRIALSAERGVVVATIASLATAAVLVRLLIARDYRVAYVWEYTSNSLADIYAFTALWGGQSGSLLFWLCILGVVSVIALAQNRTRHPELHPHMCWVLGSVQLFFFILLVFVAQPFELLAEKYPEAMGQIPFEGNGLNPQLQNFGMIIHPPLLYFGYVTFASPFAFAIAALATGRLTPEWLRASRPWTILSWTILGFGILCGARWAYVELGWGGYWAWDPVENASLMPWLTGTAFLHSVMIEERRGMLRRWNIFLVIATFLLCIFGTFLTRSGILSSVHSFTQSGIGSVFIAYMILWGVIGAAFFAHRWEALRSRYAFDSFLSREAAFLFQNLLLVGICAAVMWGTMYPIISEWITGEKITVNAPYFNRVILPLGLALFMLTGAGPMISWRSASWPGLARNLGIPTALLVISFAASEAMGSTDLMASGGFGLAVFVIAAVAVDLFICARARARSTGEGVWSSAFVLADRNHRRYGGFLCHVGMALLLVGLSGAAFNLEAEKHLAPGETLSAGRFAIRYDGYREDNDGHRNYYLATVSLTENGRDIGLRHPEISVYFPGEDRETRNSEVAIRSSLWEDVYIIFAEPDGQNAVMRLMVHPLVGFVWFGGLIVVLGAALAMVPDGLALRLLRRAEAGTLAEAGAAALVVALLASPASAETTAAYSRAIGNRDPASATLNCLCGCRMVLHDCDHPNCPSSGPLLDELGEMRERGLDEDKRVEEMIARHGAAIRALPPTKGFHLSAWLLPGAGIAAGALVIALGVLRVLKRGTTPGSSVPAAAPSATATAEVEAALAKRRDEMS